MNFGQFLSILRARWKVALLILTLVVITAIALSLLLPKRYLAIASVVVDSRPDPISLAINGGMLSPTFMATQADIIQSDRVALRVVRKLKLADSSEVRQQWLDDTKGQGTIEQWLVDTLQKNMDVKPSRESNVISVSYKAQDPNFAAGLANAFVQAYLDTSLELRVDPAKQYSTFFDTRAKEAREALEKAQSKQSEYQKAKGITVSDDRFDVETARLNELSSQLVVLQALSAESGSRQIQANGSSGDKLQEVLTSGLISSLKSDLGRAEAKLQELSSRYGDNHPLVLETKASIGELRKKVDLETRRITGGVGVSNTINRQREAEIRAALDAQREKVLRLKALREEGAVLTRDVENAQRAYEQVFARLNQTSLESQTTQSNVVVLTQATPPVDPAFPKMTLNIILALVVGTLLAIGTTMLLELADRRVRSAIDVSVGLGLPLLGILPKPTARRIFGKPSASMMQQRLLGNTSVAGRGA